jgi:Reverse transcriptase (RNA-dependent DNA polymerase)
MSDPTNTTTALPTQISTPSVSTVSSVTTRNMSAQQARADRQNSENDAAAAEDQDKTNGDKRKERTTPTFKGRCAKMSGNVFELTEEGRNKSNQFTETMTALYRYASQELDCVEDLDPLFASPTMEPEIDKPPTQPPLIDDPAGVGKIRATRDFFEYHDWKNECDNYAIRKKELRKNNIHLFAVILEQCSASVENKLKGSPGYAEANRDHSCYWLVITLKNICHSFEHHKYKFNSLIAAKQAIFNYKQHGSQSTTAYHDAFCELVDILEIYGGSIHDPHDAAPKNDPVFNELTGDDAKDDYMRDRYLAALYLRNADPGRFEKLATDLEHAYSVGRHEFPTSLQSMHELLLAHEPKDKLSGIPSGGSSSRNRNRNRNRNNRTPNTGQSTTSPGTTNTGGTPTSSATTNTGRSSSSRTGKSVLQTGFCMSQVGLCLSQVDPHFPDGIPSHFILLDSDSTISIFNNADFLTDIHDVHEPLFLETNGGGQQVSTQMGNLAGFGPVWYNPDSIANVLSLAEVRRIRRVTMDTAQSPAFIVHRPAGKDPLIFSEHASGLYLLDASLPDHVPVMPPPAPASDATQSTVLGHSYLQTVADNKALFTARQIAGADAARHLYRLLGRPGPSRFLSAIRNNHVLNCPVTLDDAVRAETIYGKDVAFVKGKTTDGAPTPHIVDFLPSALPPDILATHGRVTLCVDIFYVHGLAFCLSTSRSIRYLCCHFIPDRTKSTLSACISSDLATYQSRGFSPAAIHADSEFSVCQPLFPGLQFSICAVDAHVPEVERAIRTVKETIRATIHGMPFSRLPRVLIKELVASAVAQANMFPHPDGVSPTLSPSAIVTGAPKPDFRCMPLEFGQYVQVFDGTSNDTRSRTLGAIATTPTNNSSGDHFFLSLATGHRIHRRSWTIIPISDTVISRVEAIASQESMPLIDDAPMLPEYDPDALVDAAAYDRDYTPPPAADPASDHHLTTDAYTDSSDDDSSATDDVGHHPDFDDAPLPPPVVPVLPPLASLPSAPAVERPVPSQPGSNVVVNDVENEERDLSLHTIIAAQNEEHAPQPASQNEERTPQTAQTEERNDVVTDVENEERDPSLNTIIAAINDPSITTMDHLIPAPPSLDATAPAFEPRRSSKRPNSITNYKQHFNLTQFTHPIKVMPPVPNEHFPPEQMQSIQRAITGLMFTQMSATKGIKKHGDLAVAALRKEFEQFRTLEVLEPLDAFAMTDEQKTDALRAISVIKEKRDGTIKGRTCADGSTQHGKFTKAETGSPTIANDALYLSVMIDAYERRDVATADVAGAYLHALMKHFISMRFVGWAVDLLCEVNPDYAKYVVTERVNNKDVKVLYVRCNKAIYGCVVSGVLWYELFSTTLEQHGFVTNPYDFCVANAIIEGSQCTIGWFVDDTKISHVNPDVVTSIIHLLEERFGKMSVTRGASHKFLGMNITYLSDGTATVHMPSYIHEAITESNLHLGSPAATPCCHNLLSIDAASPLLSRSKAQTFHSVVAKLIYVGTRARTDILLALSFLCSRVSAPTEQDEQKLRRLLSYLQGTIDLTLRIGADSLSQFSTWVDASFAVHNNMRSHTGGVISFGRGGLVCKSKRQTINTKSSTEAELVGASDYLPNTLYVKLFMEAQGYPINQALFHQDNESAIKMEENGKASCGQRSRHIDIRYFFITDHSQRSNIHIVHCPTTDMLADFFTKPLQGALFRKFRSILLGYTHIDTLSLSPSAHESIAERVEEENPETQTDPVTDPANQTADDKQTVSFVD